MGSVEMLLNKMMDSNEVEAYGNALEVALEMALKMTQEKPSFQTPGPMIEMLNERKRKLSMRGS